jgi:hypothetical protein
MGHPTLHDKVLESYIKHLTIRNAVIPPDALDIAEACIQLVNDIDLFKKFWNTRYINPRTSIPKDGSLHLAWEYANDPAYYYLFAQMLCVSPYVFNIILELIKPVRCQKNNVENKYIRIPFGLSPFSSCFRINSSNIWDYSLGNSFEDSDLAVSSCILAQIKFRSPKLGEMTHIFLCLPNHNLFSSF